MHGSLFNLNHNSSKPNQTKTKLKKKSREAKGWNRTRAPSPRPSPRRSVAGREQAALALAARRPRALSLGRVLKGPLHSGGTALAPAGGGAGSRGTGRGAQHSRAGPPGRWTAGGGGVGGGADRGEHEG